MTTFDDRENAFESKYAHDADMQVRAEAPSPADGQAHLMGTYVASEYAGSRVLALFASGRGAHFEVEYHLGHRRPPEFAPGQRYALCWQAADTLAYAA